MQANFETERECVGPMEAALVELVQSWLVGFQLLGTVSRAPPSRVSAGSAHRDPACLPCTCLPVHRGVRMQLQQRAGPCLGASTLCTQLPARIRHNDVPHTRQGRGHRLLACSTRASAPARAADRRL